MCICTNKESKEKKGTCKHTGSGAASTCSCNCDDCLDCRGHSCKENCKPAAGNLSICKASQGNTLTVGQRDQVSARFNCGYAGNRHIGWRSSNPNVVKVDCYGNLTAVGEGYACIYAYVYGNSSVYDKITIHVTANGSSSGSGSSGSGSSGSSGSGSSGSRNENPGTSGGSSGSEGGNTPTAGASYKFICQNGENRVLGSLMRDITNGMQLSICDDLSGGNQTFICESYEDGYILKNRKNPAYVVNRNSGNNNAIVWTWATDADTVSDSLVEFETVENGIYRIKLAEHGLYLTAESNENDAKVNWLAKDTANGGQLWKCVLNTGIEDVIPDARALTMPTNICQHYTKTYEIEGVGVFSTWIYNEGCAACSFEDVEGFYANQTFELDYVDWETRSVNWVGDYANYSKVPQNSKNIFVTDNITPYSENNETYYDRIRKEIAGGHPVVIRYGTDFRDQHFVVAFKYISSGENLQDMDTIYVLDPSNIYPAGQKEGAIRTLRESIDCNFCNRIKSETNCADEDIYNHVYIINLVATSKK